MKDGYGPVLKMLGQRTESSSTDMTWVALVLLILPIILLLGNYLRHYLQKRRNIAYSFDQLEKIGSEKQLNYLEQSVVSQMATIAHMSNPAFLLSSIEGFDHSVSIWVKYLMQQPWQNMDAQIAHLVSIRKKANLRYLSPERPPVSTRELNIDQKIYSLAASQKGLKLIYAKIIDLDDLCITTSLFQTDRQKVHLSKNHDIWGFFWSEGGMEFRFRTRLLKEINHVAHYLMLYHGDELFHDTEWEMFTCQQDIELVVDWVSNLEHGTNLSPNIYDRIETPPTLVVNLNQLSSSGFTLSFDKKLEIDDLLRVRGGNQIPAFLADRIGRVIKVSEEGVFCRFLKIDHETRHDMITYIAKNMSVASFAQRLKKPAKRF